MANFSNININISEVIEEFRLTKDQVDVIRETVKDGLVTEIYRNWSDEAKKGLNQTREIYLSFLNIIDTGRFSGSIVLTGQLPNMIESGCSAFDMKSAFEKSTKVNYNKNGGWYLTIPFRFATPGADGFSSVFAGVLPLSIYDLIKNYQPQKTQTTVENIHTTVIMPSKTSSKSLKESDIPKPFNLPKTRERVIAESINKVYEEYVHKSSIYAGLQRSEKTYDSATQGTYNTFRRVGANSDPLAFIYPGLVARNFSEKGVSLTDTQTIVDNIVDKNLADFGFGSD